MSPTTVNTRRAVRVAPVPADHPYVRAVLPPGEDLRILDPTQTSASTQWQPHPFLEADELRGLDSRPDVIHVHFGFEHRTTVQVQEFVDACADLGIRLLVTVHDLENPHLPQDRQEEHHARLRILLRAADAVLTLTGSAADAIRSGYGREAVVVPHPFVLAPQTAHELHAAVARRSPVTSRTVGIFLKDVRVNTVRTPGFYRALARALTTATNPVDLRVFAHRTAADHPLVQTLRNGFHPHGEPVTGGTLQLHDRLDDRDLALRIMALDAVVLPYTHGTHSGWLELCRDLGVGVVAPDCGHYADQADRPDAVQVYRTVDGTDAARSALRVLNTTADDGSRPALPYRGDRLAQQRAVVTAHRDLLTNVLRGRSAEVVA
ncbi:glycosyltransferase [Kocuria sp. JC486]|uniref:glycosyltransferase n=1 Tax=Kocuria sp. JC486 TaxID=1970736 RepID=UPI0014230712|nr:glycosyltransferase [Kocuria sp. JC486]NHU85424.1 glycosyltransferase [Kocuria sp. JC486]